MKKKGFTLIELLAVIIILAVIALIATPIVLNVVDSAKESARKSSIAGYADAMKLGVSDYMFTSDGSLPKIDTAFQLKYKPKGENISCEGVYSSNHNGIVLHNCTVGTYEKKYCFAKGNHYDCNNTDYKNILNDVANDIDIAGDSISKTVFAKFPQLATTGNGCTTPSDNNYSYMGGCYLKGEQTTNYIWFNGFLYRIIGVNKDGSIRLIMEESVTTIAFTSKSTIPTYQNSYVREWLNNYFYQNIGELKNQLVKSTSDNNGLFCSGEPTTSETSTRIDCTGGTIFNDYVGLISIDEMNLSKKEDGSSYLGNSQYAWTMSPCSNDYWWILYYENGLLTNYVPHYSYGVRPVINIKSSTIITAGDGSLSNYYVLGEEKIKTDITGNLYDIAKIGEYVQFTGNENKFRIVSKDENGIKVILDGYKDYAVNSWDSIGKVQDANYISSLVGENNVNKLVNTTWYKGNMFEEGTNYTQVLEDRNNPYQGSTGLIRYGEMLSGTSASILTKDYTMPSNRDNGSSYWLNNRKGSYSFWYIEYIAEASGNSNINYQNRPVVNLNINTTIIKGNGLLEHPYEI